MILYGASGHCKVIIDILEALQIPIDFIVDDNPVITELLGYEVRRNSGVYDEAIVAIGACEIRRQIVRSIRVRRYPTVIHPTAIISPRAAIGCGTVVMQGAIVQSSAAIGSHNIINTGASVEHDCRLSDFVHIASHATLTGGVQIGEGTWIGAGSVIRQGITIGAGTMIGAGSVVVKDIPANVVAFGNPCRVIREIDKTNKYMAKNQNVAIDLRGGVIYRSVFVPCNLNSMSYAA